MEADYLPGGDTIAYILQERVGAPLTLCVMDRRAQQYHTFPLSLANASRLAAECSTAINTAIGGADYKGALETIMAKK
jgi:hypothetical protein